MYTSAIRRHLKANLKDRYTLHTHIVSYRKVPFYEDKEKKRTDYKFDIQEENASIFNTKF